MLIGIITTKHLMRHPITVIHDYGFVCFLFGILYTLDPKKHTWLECVMKHQNK